MSRPREELAARFEQLLGSKNTADTVALLTLAGNSTGTDFLKDFLNRFSQDSSDGNQKWQSDVFQDQVKAQLNSNRTAMTPAMMDAAPERIAFLGRPESAQTLAQQTVQEAAESSRPTLTGSQLQESVMAQITDRISFAQYHAQGGEIRIALRPEHLGDLHLKVKIDQDVVTAKFVAESQEVKAIIEANLGQLRDALSQAGIKVGRFDVTVDTGARNGSNSEQGGLSHPAHAPELAAATATEPAYDESLMIADDVIYSMRPFATAASRYSYLA